VTVSNINYIQRQNKAVSCETFSLQQGKVKTHCLPFTVVGLDLANIIGFNIKLK
jgi:hypothetical protein